MKWIDGFLISYSDLADSDNMLDFSVFGFRF
jgi:hypothetical protein